MGYLKNRRDKKYLKDWDAALAFDQVFSAYYLAFEIEDESIRVPLMNEVANHASSEHRNMLIAHILKNTKRKLDELIEHQEKAQEKIEDLKARCDKIGIRCDGLEERI